MIRVNGKEEALEGTVLLEAYLREKGYRTERIAVEKNGAIVPKAQYGLTEHKAGDVLEIVSFVGGG